MDTTWTYRDEVMNDHEGLAGYSVEASDGHIGKIDEASNQAGRSHIVVDTGFWIFGTKRLVPAGVVRWVDRAKQTVGINLSKDQVKQAPEWSPDWSDEDKQADYSSYYGPFSQW